MDIVEELRRAGSVSALARQAGVHRETIHQRLREARLTLADVLRPRKGRHANVCGIATSGIRYYYADPRPEMVTLDDLARGLSNICRFSGAPVRFLSVAEHAVNVAKRVLLSSGSRRIALCALHHDSHEAYLGDVATPLKKILGLHYRRLCDRADAAIVESLGLADAWWESKPYVAEADLHFLHQEALALHIDGHLHGFPAPRLIVPDEVVAEEDFLFLAPHDAYAAFLDAHSELESA